MHLAAREIRLEQPPALVTRAVVPGRDRAAVARLQRRPHDALLATVSHLPHVLANVLVARAARLLSDEGERLPATGPSFRDATRVAGANTAIWRDIYLANADALVSAIDDTVARLSEVRAALEARDGGAVAA